MLQSDWENRLVKLVDQYPDLSSGAVAATRGLLARRGASARQPDEMARGYWPTICLVWSSSLLGQVEIEVSATEYEYYGPNGEVDIRHFPHEGGAVVPDDLLALIPN